MLLEHFTETCIIIKKNLEVLKAEYIQSNWFLPFKSSVFCKKKKKMLKWVRIGNVLLNKSTAKNMLCVSSKTKSLNLTPEDSWKVKWKSIFIFMKLENVRSSNL